MQFYRAIGNGQNRKGNEKRQSKSIRKKAMQREPLTTATISSQAKGFGNMVYATAARHYLGGRNDLKPNPEKAGFSSRSLVRA